MTGYVVLTELLKKFLLPEKWQRCVSSSQLSIESITPAMLSSRQLFFVQLLIIVTSQLPVSSLGLTQQRRLLLQSMCVSNLRGCWVVLAATRRLEEKHLVRNEMRLRWC